MLVPSLLWDRIKEEAAPLNHDLTRVFFDYTKFNRLGVQHAFQVSDEEYKKAVSILHTQQKYGGI